MQKNLEISFMLANCSWNQVPTNFEKLKHKLK